MVEAGRWGRRVICGDGIEFECEGDFLFEGDEEEELERV